MYYIDLSRLQLDHKGMVIATSTRYIELEGRSYKTKSQYFRFVQLTAKGHYLAEGVGFVFVGVEGVGVT